MKIARTGLILYVNKYETCVSFYKNILELTILFDTPDLTCFDLFDTYLMVEREDRPEYMNIEKQDKASTCIRINVDDVKAAADIIRQKGIDIKYYEFDWGKVAKFRDPAGNMIAYKDEEGFLFQLKNHR